MEVGPRDRAEKRERSGSAEAPALSWLGGCARAAVAEPLARKLGAHQLQAQLRRRSASHQMVAHPELLAIISPQPLWLLF